ncbi:MAG: DUF4860 domain-containing protein [Clostridium sp.]
MKSLYRSKKGITLIELLVSIAIFGIIMVVMGTLMNSSSKFYVKSNQNVTGVSEARVALSYVVNKFREFDEVGMVELVSSSGDVRKFNEIKIYNTTDNKHQMTIKLEKKGEIMSLVEEQVNSSGASSVSDIAHISSFSIKHVLGDSGLVDSWDKRTIEITITYSDSTEVEKSISTVLTKKCDFK